MKKRILNGVAWVLLFAASILAIGGFNGPDKDLIVFLSVSVLAGVSILLFWLGGYTCKSNTSPTPKHVG